MFIHPLTLIAMFLAIIAHTFAAVMFKIAAQQTGWRIVMYMALGAGIGFFNPLFTSLAFSNTNPCFVLAFLGIIGGLVFVTTLRVVFRQPLTRIQWLGIALLIIGGTLISITPDAISS